MFRLFCTCNFLSYFLPSGFVLIVPAITLCMCGASFSVRTRSTLPLWKILCLYPLFAFAATKLCGFISRSGRVWLGMEMDMRVVYVYECVHITFARSLFLYIYEALVCIYNVGMHVGLLASIYVGLHNIHLVCCA